MGEEWKGENEIPPDSAGLTVDFGIISPTENIINADIIKIGKNNQRVCWRNTLAGFIFGYERLLDAGFHLQRDLSQAALFAQLAKVVLHDTSPMTFCHSV